MDSSDESVAVAEAPPEPSPPQHSLSDKEVKEFKEIFELMDRDKGGTLDAEEIKQLMDMLGMKVRPDELDQMIKEVDTDGSGQVDFEEFLQVMAKPLKLPYARQDVTRAFQIFAQPDDPPGMIRPDVLEKALTKYAGDKYGAEEVIRLVNGLDMNSHGFIDFKQKIDFMMQ